jgi:hypothetical protein
MTSRAQCQLQNSAKNCLKIDMFSKRRNAENAEEGYSENLSHFTT